MSDAAVPPADSGASNDAEGPPLFAIENGVATIELRRPSQRNSLRDEDLRRLLAQFAQVDADPAVRVLVLRARTGTATSPAPRSPSRPVFCAGYHVAGFDAGQDAERVGPALFEQVADVLERLRPVTICALGGSVYGGATDLVLACDLRIGVTGAEFRMPACALGLHYYPGGLRRYVARLGLATAQRAFLTALPLPLERLDAIGLFERLVPAEAFDDAVRALVRQVAALAPLAAQATKRSLREIAAGDADPAALRARESMTRRSADFAEGRAAFAERRAPRFEGR